MIVSQSTSVSDSLFLVCYYVCVTFHICFWKSLLGLLLWLCHIPHQFPKVSSWSVTMTVSPSTSVSESPLLVCYYDCVTIHSVSESLFLVCYYDCATIHMCTWKSPLGLLLWLCHNPYPFLKVASWSVAMTVSQFTYVSESFFLVCYYDCVTIHSVSKSLFLVCYYDCVTIHSCFWKSLLGLLLWLCHHQNLFLKVSSWSVTMTVSQYTLFLKVYSRSVTMIVLPSTSVFESLFLVCCYVCVTFHICFWKSFLGLYYVCVTIYICFWKPLLGLLPWPHNTLCIWTSLLGLYYDCVTIHICFWKSLLVLLLWLCHNPHLSLKVSSWSVAMTVSPSISVSESLFLVCYYDCFAVHSVSGSLFLPCYYVCVKIHSVSGSLFLPCYYVCVTIHSVSGSLFLPCY